ncbi:uncharacterized protein [Aquarana catesbeiana]|uniref:uncharacterized protein n=1 Tax=Aquarana catesbeiana TaxID=8400 RepID=UPI003CC9C779
MMLEGYGLGFLLKTEEKSQDRLQAQRRRRQRAEEQESSTSSCSVIQSEGETEEEAEAATPTSAEQEVEETCPVEAAGDAEEQPDAADPGSEVFILQLQPVDEDLDLPASGWTGCPSESPVVSTVLHPSTSPHLASPVHPSPAPEQAHIPHPPEPHVTDYLRRIVEVQKRHFAFCGPPQSPAAPSLCGSAEPATSGSFAGRDDPPPPPITVGEETKFEVEAILDCWIPHEVERVPEESSWEPASNVHAPRLLHEFFSKHPE